MSKRSVNNTLLGTLENGRDEAKATRGLARLVLALISTLKDLMERQAKRRISEGSLSDRQVERLGRTFMALNLKLAEIGRLFDLEPSELRLEGDSLDFGKGETTFYPMKGPAEKISIAELLDSLIEKGVVVLGDLDISVAEVELINCQLRLVLNTVRKRMRQKVGRKESSWAFPEEDHLLAPSSERRLRISSRR